MGPRSAGSIMHCSTFQMPATKAASRRFGIGELRLGGVVCGEVGRLGQSERCKFRLGNVLFLAVISIPTASHTDENQKHRTTTFGFLEMQSCQSGTAWTEYVGNRSCDREIVQKIKVFSQQCWMCYVP